MYGTRLHVITRIPVMRCAISRNAPIFCILVLLANPAYAGCPAGYGQEQRRAISINYQRQIDQVNAMRDERIRKALDAYQQEYYADAKDTYEEWAKERAQLAEQMRSDDAARQNQKAYNDEARSIGKEYRQEIRGLQKDHSGKYWKEISEARDDARQVRGQLHEMKAEDIAELKQELANDCKTTFRQKVRKMLEWIGGADGGGGNQDNEPENIGVLGIRG